MTNTYLFKYMKQGKMKNIPQVLRILKQEKKN